MNLALLFDEDFMAPDRAILRGRRLAHLHSVIKVVAGDTVPVGREGGQIGTGEVVRLTDTEAELQVTLDQPPPAPLPLTLILAMPRPKMFRRILQTCAALGVKDLWLINSYKVEKSFWQTPWLSDQQVRENLTLGLEQSKDTLMPRVQIRKLFKPFVEDELPSLVAGRKPGSTPRHEHTLPDESEPADGTLHWPRGWFYRLRSRQTRRRRLPGCPPRPPHPESGNCGTSAG